MIGLVLLQPEELGDGVAGKHRVPGPGNKAFFSTESIGELPALGHGLCIAPQLGRPDHFIMLIEDDESMLLPAHPDTTDARPT